MASNTNPSGDGSHAHGPWGSGKSQHLPSVHSITQATHLPKECAATLLEVTKLTTQSSLTAWGNEIVHVLRTFHLESLVNLDLPKPHAGAVDFGKWKYWTHIVASWLFRQVDTTIQQRVKSYSREIVYADDLFKAIKELALPDHSAYVANEVQKWENLKREDFTTSADYILAYQNQFNRLKAESHEPAYDFAMNRLFAVLESELPNVPFLREEVADVGRPVDYQLFSYYCRVLLGESRKTGAGNIVPGSDADSSSRARGREISYRGWRDSVKGKRPQWD